MAPSEPARDLSLAFDTLHSRDDMGDANALVRAAHWNQIEADWRVFLDYGTVYAVRDDNNRVIATAATLPHGGFAWISMVLVAPEHRRKALGTKLLRRCIDDLLAQNLVPVLDATPAGREVYRPLGFLDAWGFHRLALRERPCPSANPGQTEPASLLRSSPRKRGPRASAEDSEIAALGSRLRGNERSIDMVIQKIDDAVWPALCRYDAEAFGADRSKLLNRLRGRSLAELVATRGGRIVGFLMGRDGRVAAQLGPLIADDDATAQVLLARGIGVVGGPLYIDVPDSKTVLLDFLAAQGFTPERPFTRMLHGRSTGFEDAARTFALVGPEFG
jgi:GNAT superfamily N-acetyltransferase